MLGSSTCSRGDLLSGEASSSASDLYAATTTHPSTSSTLSPTALPTFATLITIPIVPTSVAAAVDFAPVMPPNLLPPTTLVLLVATFSCVGHRRRG